eukprot:9522789-Ditylum_brightwellii.AAC.1
MFIGKLEKLEYIDASQNFLNLLPGSVPWLKELTHLSINGNTVPCLAFQPILNGHNDSKSCDQIDKESGTETNKLNADGVWQEFTDHKSGRRLYYNRKSGETSSTKPPIFWDKKDNGKDNVVKYQKHKTLLAHRGIPEWEINMDKEKGEVSFTNNVSGEIVHKIPHRLDLLGSLNKLVSLKANDNLLCELPNSLATL